ncbi:hypothetical protein FIBSPDRAFT_928042 [Athelia psychrophila]|uniref:Uncharacterized protein n=1 Tax=Athelia psychrophila TaxID=1759441 RepID=A0A166QT97_9AGAM|nr:hypothetical protein FIBSPDRAFT_928042 [Fibularhizoctonia sp. CBS 109695]
MPQTNTKNEGKPTKSASQKENTGANRPAPGAPGKSNSKVKILEKTVPFFSNIQRYGNFPLSKSSIYVRCVGVNLDRYQCTELQGRESRPMEPWFCHSHREGKGMECEPSQAWYRRCRVTASGATTKQCWNSKSTAYKVKAQRPWSCGSRHQFQLGDTSPDEKEAYSSSDTHLTNSSSDEEEAYSLSDTYSTNSSEFASSPNTSDDAPSDLDDKTPEEMSERLQSQTPEHDFTLQPAASCIEREPVDAERRDELREGLDELDREYGDILERDRAERLDPEHFEHAENPENRRAAWEVNNADRRDALRERVDRLKRKYGDILERDRAERLDRARAEREHADAEQAPAESERLEQERITHRAEQERLRIARAGAERPRIESDRLGKKIERERVERERLGMERLAREHVERERAEHQEKEIAERVRVQVERLRNEQIERERAEQERLEVERLAREHVERERAEHQEKEIAERVRVQVERLRNEQIERERAEQERLEVERLAREHVKRERAKHEENKPVGIWTWQWGCTIKLTC